MIELEKVKKIAKELQQGTYSKDLDQALILINNLIAAAEEKDAVLQAWQSVFGTSQLSHAQARLECAEEEVKKIMKAEIAEQARLITERDIAKELISDLQAELLEAKKWCFDDTTVASLREELKTVREENDGLQSALDEANGLVMGREFRAAYPYHLPNRH